MQQLFVGFIWFLFRGPLTLGAVAVAILGLGYYLQIGQNERNALKAEALLAGPPAAVDIAKFDRDLHATELREVVVRGQAAMDFAYELTIEKDSGDDEGFMVPLLSETATDETAVVGIAFFHDRNFSFDDLTPAFLMEDVVGFGDVGLVVEYNGKVSSLGSWKEMTEEAFFEQGLTFSDDIVVVWPFIDGREAAFAPPKEGDMTIFGLMSKIAGALGLLALAKLMFGKKPDDDAPALESDDALMAQRAVAPEFVPIPEKGVLDRPIADQNVGAVPLWKQRAGMTDVAQPAQAPQAAATFETVDFNAPTPDASPLVQPQKRSGFGLRKMLIGIVGLAFAVMLGSVVWGLIEKSGGASQTVSVITAQERLAEGVADIVVPDADPNRHWTDIDVTPVIEWFVAKGMLAMTGDQDAQIALGMIFGGVFFAMFALRWFFLVRSTLKPTRRVHSFDDLTTG